MTSLRPKIVGLALALLICSPARSQRSREPLNPLEIDQLRATAQDADARLKLYLELLRLRLTTLERLRSDPKTTDLAQQTHDKLQDFLDLYDELDDNIDTFADRGSDLRSALRTVIAADTEFQSRLRAVKSAADARKEDEKLYEFLLTSSVETVAASIEDHRQLLSKQKEAARHKSPVKP